MMMTYHMPILPYDHAALEPVISRETIDFHYGKHLQTYIDNLNKLVTDTEFDGMSLEELVIAAPEGAIYNNAGQALNHMLYFLQFTPNLERHYPTGKLADTINMTYGSFEAFKNAMNNAAITLFGSGWAWLALDTNGNLHILQESNAGNPLRRGMNPLLCFDVWEHAYYLDYQNRRADHIAALWDLIDWQIIENRM